MPKDNLQTFVLGLHIYPYEVMFSTEDYDSVIAIIAKKGYEVDEVERNCLKMRGYGSCTMLANGNVVVRLAASPDSPADIAILGHEIFHAIEMIFRNIGISLTEASSEAYSYAIQYLLKAALEGFAKPATRQKKSGRAVRR